VAGYDLPAAAAAPATRTAWFEAGATAADLETAALLALGERLGVAVAACLVVAEAPAGVAADEQLIGPRLLALAEDAARALAALADADVAAAGLDRAGSS
jgi:uridine phosphorylase